MQRLPHRRSRGAGRLASALLMAAVLASCGGSDGQSRGDAEEKRFLVDYLRSDYLWNDQLPAQISISEYPDVDTTLEALKYTQDRYSYIAPAEAYNDFFAGKTVGFGINFRVEEDVRIRLLGVQPTSPAASAGLLRGDVITEIEGKQVADWVAEEKLDEAFGEVQPGVKRTFAITRGQTPVSITVTKAAYNLSYVPASGAIDNMGRKVGYVNFYSFSDAGVGSWNATLDSLLEQGARDLIVDLRFNGGGLLATAAQIGSALGSNSLAGKTMTSLTHNAQQSGRNTTFSFLNDNRAGRFDNLVWLTSANTCSASEALILGIKAWRSATIVGERTCGKPVGFRPPVYGDKVYSIVTFRLRNANDETDYFDGLKPDCEVVENGDGALGSAQDSLTGAALQILAGGNCPTASANRSAQAKQLPAPRWTGLRGFEALTNLK